MFAVEIYAMVPRFVFVEGKSRREAARVFGLSRCLALFPLPPSPIFLIPLSAVELDEDDDRAAGKIGAAPGREDEPRTAPSPTIDAPGVWGETVVCDGVRRHLAATGGTELATGPVKQPAEELVEDIRRAARRPFSAEGKIRIELEGLRGEASIAELGLRKGIASSLYSGWSKESFWRLANGLDNLGSEAVAAIANLGHHRWLRLKSLNGKPAGDVTMPTLVLRP